MLGHLLLSALITFASFAGISAATTAAATEIEIPTDFATVTTQASSIGGTIGRIQNSIFQAQSASISRDNEIRACVGKTPSLLDTDMLKYLKFQHLTLSWYSGTGGGGGSNPGASYWPITIFAGRPDCVPTPSAFNDNIWQWRNIAEAVRWKILTPLILFESIWVNNMRRILPRVKDAKTLFAYQDTLNSYQAQCASQPVLEIIYAWAGDDNWEGATAGAGGAWTQTIPTVTGATDITSSISKALNGGGVYIMRPPHAFSAASTFSRRAMIPKFPRTAATLSGGGRDLGPYSEYAYVSSGNWTALSDIPDVGIATDTAAQTTDRTGKVFPGVVYPLPSAFPDGWQVDTWLAAPAAAYTPTTVGGVTVYSEGALGDTTGALASSAGKTVGIIYRDANGIHFRRFESWQNIVLPMPTTFQINSSFKTQANDTLSNTGGYFHGHQFEEGSASRGLVTATVSGPHIVFMANDRVANFHTTTTTPPTLTTSVGKDVMSYTFSPTGYSKGMPQPWCNNGPDFHHWSGFENNLFQMSLSSTAGTKIMLQSAFPSHTMSGFYDPENTGVRNYVQDISSSSYSPLPFPAASTTNTSNVNNIFWPFNDTSTCANPGTSLNRAIYDENGTRQVLTGSADFDSTLANVKLPSSSGPLNVWWAFDNTSVTFGTGAPESQDDIDAGSNGITTLFTRTIPYCRYLRHFGFRADPTTWAAVGTAAPTAPPAITVSNIKSKFLSPAKKFCTPPHLNGKFLFWRDAWKATTADAFSVQFKARGENIQIAFGPRTATERTSGTVLDTSYQYALRATATTLTVERRQGWAAPVQLAIERTQNAPILGENGSNKEKAYDYWVALYNGVIQFGQGTTVGQNIVATATDAAPLTGNISYSFSSDKRTTDYTGITCSPYQITTNVTAAGQYTNWVQAQSFSTADSGSVVFSYQNTATSPSAATHKVMLGLASQATFDALKQSAPAATVKPLPEYQIVLGSRNNTAHEIFKRAVSSNVKSTSPAIAMDSEWHDMWVMFDRGAIAYGSGNQVGANVQGSWTDPSPSTGIKYFCFTSAASTMTFKLASTTRIESQNSYLANPDTSAQSQTLWRLETPSQGAFTVTAVPQKESAASTEVATLGTLQIGLTNETNDPLYEVIINDAGKAYINKSQIKQATTVSVIPDTQPITATSPYWVIFKNGAIIVGTGSIPLATNTTLLSWQDTSFDATASNAITKFTLAASGRPISYTNIATVPSAVYATNLAPVMQSLTAQVGIAAGWNTDPTKITLTNTAQSPYYWHENLKFATNGQATFSFTVSTQNATQPTLCVGFANAIPTNGLNTPTHYVALDTRTGILSAGHPGQPTLSTSPVLSQLKMLSDGKQHTVWISLKDRDISVGVDCAAGTSPCFSKTNAFAIDRGSPLVYPGVSLSQGSAAYTGIASRAFADFTTYTTQNNQQLTWQQPLSLGSLDQGMIQFTVTPDTDSVGKLTFGMGLGTATAGTTTPPATGPWNDAQYVVCIDYTGQVYGFKAPNFTTKLNPVRYASTDATKNALILKASTTAGASCSLSYDHGRFSLSINSTTVWTYTDPTPLSGITRFAFGSLQSVAVVTDIASNAGSSLQTIQANFPDPLADIASSTDGFITKLQSALIARLHLQDDNAKTYFLNTVVAAIRAHYELFNEDQRATLLDLMNDVAAESLSVEQKKTLVNAKSPVGLTTLLATPLNYIELAAQYKTQIPSLLIGTSSVKAVAPTSPLRQLFMQKLQKLASLQATDLNTPNLLATLQALVNSIPTSAVLTLSEAAVVANLRTMTSTQAILSTSEDPSTILQTLPQLLDLNQRVSALVSFLTKRANARADQTSTPPVTLTAAQKTQVVDLLAGIVEKRDWLTAEGTKNCAFAIQLATAAPDLSTTKTSAVPNYPQGQSLADLTTKLSTEVAFSARVQTATTDIGGIITLPSTNQTRQLFFSYLDGITALTSKATNADITRLQSEIITKLLAVPLTQTETATVTTLQKALTSTASQNNTFAYQLTTLQNTVASLSDYIAGIKTLLVGKGTTTLFASADFDTLYTQFVYIVNSRELLPSSAAGTTSVNTIIDLLQIAKLAPELSPRSADLDALIAAAGTAYNFADRITTMKAEIDIVKARIQDALKTAQQNNSTVQPVDYFYNRLVSKLNIVCNAPGLKTDAQFSDLQLNVLSPLMGLTIDKTKLNALQTLATAITSQKSTIMADQGTFKYQYTAALAQKDTPSIYISMLQNIIAGERQGLITFNVSRYDTNTRDENVFYNALANVVAKRDSLSENDLANLLTTINYAQYSDSFKRPKATDSTLVTQLQVLSKTASTPMLFADRVNAYATQRAAIMAVASTNSTRIAFFNALSSLIGAPGDKTKDALTKLADEIVTPLLASPLSVNEKAIIDSLNLFLTSSRSTLQTAAYQMTQLSKSADLVVYIQGLKELLGAKGVSATFTQADFETFYTHLVYLVNNRELLHPVSPTATRTLVAASAVPPLVSATISLLQSASIVTELASHKDDIAQLLTTLSLPHLFAERVQYMQTEVALLVKQVNDAAAKAASTPMEQTVASFNFLIDRITTKLQILLNAPGIATEDLFNSLETGVVTPLIALLSTDATRQTALQTIRTTINTRKSSVLAQQKTFTYNFSLAKDQKANTSTYVTMLKNIIENERQGIITFNTTTNPSDAVTFINALDEVVGMRDTLSTADLTTLITALNYTQYSTSVIGDTLNGAALVKRIQTLSTAAATPIPFADRVANYKKMVNSMLALKPADASRIAFFQNLSTLLDAPGLKTPESLSDLSTFIVTPCSASPLADTEKSVIAVLGNALANAQDSIKSAAYQINVLSASPDLAATITGLKSLLTNKGISVVFTADDFELFYKQLQYLVDNRELLSAGANKATGLVALTTDLLRASQIVAELAAHKDDIATLITTLTLPHTFADRVAYLQKEVEALIANQAKFKDVSFVYLQDRIITKLELITPPVGIADSGLFDTLDLSVISPMLSLLSKDTARQAKLQNIRNSINAQKNDILTQQKTFIYNYQAALTQQANVSSYINLLEAIIEGERQGTIAFDNSTTNGRTPDNQTFTNALDSVVSQRDALSTNDLTTLLTAINYAQFSASFSSTQSLITRLQTMATTASTPILFAERVQTYTAQASKMLKLAQTDAARIGFFSKLSTLPDAPGTITPAACTQLQNLIITPYTASPLSANEKAIIGSLTSFVASTQTNLKSAAYQITQLSQTPDLSVCIKGLQTLLETKGVGATFAVQDFDSLYTQLQYLVDNRELLTAQSTAGIDLINLATSLLGVARVTAEYDSRKDAIQQMITDITTPHQFADRIAYLQSEISQLATRIANENPAADASSPTSPQAASKYAYLFDRIITKLGILLTAPGIATESDFNKLDSKVLTPLLTILDTDARKQAVQKIRTDLISQKNVVIKQQKTFAYNFAAAQAHTDNTSMYIGMLQNIIQSERQGTLTFDDTITSQHQQPDTQVFVDALKGLVARRDSLSATDIATLLTTLNYSIYSKSFASNATLVADLQAAYATAAIPLSFNERVTAYVTQAPAVLLLPSSDATRVSFFTNLTTLLTAPGIKNPDAVTRLLNAIVTPFNASPLSSSEQSTITALNTFVTTTQNAMKAAAYQLSFIATASDFESYIAGLKTLLSNKGISVIFTADDFESFYNQLRYLVDNRELLAAQSTSKTNLITQLTDLLNTAGIVAELSSRSQDITGLLTTLTLPREFADRVNYLQDEVAQLVAQVKNNPTPANQASPYNYLYDRIIAKLSLITTAPGIATQAGFDQLDVTVMTPLIALLASDTARQTSLQKIRNDVASQKGSILQKQQTFAYQFAAAAAQSTNTSAYISLLNSIITGERKSLITFNNSTTPPDAQIFVDAIKELVQQRDLLSANDAATLTTLINSALLSKTYAGIADLKKSLMTLQTTLATPVLFADRVSKCSEVISTIINAQSTDQNRIDFFRALQALITAPGAQTTDVVTKLQTAIIAPLSSSPLSPSEQNTLNALNNFLSNAQTTIKTASYQMTQLAQQSDFGLYVTGLQSIFTGKGTRFTFGQSDYKAFVDLLGLVTNSRELLSGQSLTAAQSLINNVLLSADFAQFATELTNYNTQINQPFYFNDRVIALAAEAQSLAARNAATDDVQLKRVFTKLGLLLSAPQLNTTDAQFNTLELQVLSPLGGLALSDDQKTGLEQLKGQLITQKAQILANQTTFKYNFAIAQSQKDNLDVYITSLKDIMVRQHNNALTFVGNDSKDLLAAIQELVDQRDMLTTSQSSALGALISYSAFSSVYQGTTDAQTLTDLYQLLSTPLALAVLVPKYAAAVPKVLFLPSTDPARIQLFAQILALTKLTERLTPALAQTLANNVSTPLKTASPNMTEQSTLQALDAYLGNASKNAQSVSYLLQVADDSYVGLFEYAQAVADIIKQKGTTLSFAAADDTSILGALAYIVSNRELLAAKEIQQLQQFIAQIIWLGTFPNNKTDLQNYSDQLATVHLMQDRINYASQELKSMILSQALPTSNRMARFVSKLKTLLDATGPVTPADFDTLQNTILAPLQGLAISADQKQIVSDLIARVTANRSAILTAQSTFAYNFTQAQLIQDNPSNYINALQNIITQKRQNLLTFQPADYQTFINALTVISDQRDGLNATDLTNLKNTINYTYYSTGFNNNTQYKQALTNIFNTLNQPITFGTRVAQYAASINDILQLDSTDLKRQRFFTNINNLPNLVGSGVIADIQEFVTSVLTPLQTIPLSQTEQTVVTSLTAFVQNIQTQAKSLSYNITLLSNEILAAEGDTTKNSVDVLINGLNTIIIQRNAGTIVFVAGDYATMVSFIDNLVSNRELLSEGQISKVQNLINSLQFSPGFEMQKQTLANYAAKLIIPLTFSERVAKYKAAIPQLNSTPAEDPAKNKFITMVTTIFNAPGNPTKAELDSLQIDVLNAINYGNFTAAQKSQIQSMTLQLSAMQTTIASFAYRLNVSQNMPSLDGYYQALSQMVTDFANGTLTLGVNDFNIFLTELEQHAVFRPLSVTTQSPFYSLVSMVKTAPTFSTRTDLVARLTQLSTLLATPSDAVALTQYFVRTTMNMLSKPKTDGTRSRHFALLDRFSSDLNAVDALTLQNPTLTTALTELQTALNQFKISTSAQPSEVSVMEQSTRQLQNITMTTAAITTAAVTPALAATTTTAQVASNGTVVVPASTATTTAQPTVSRFYRSVPQSRFAQ